MMRAVREADPAASPQVAGWAETGEAALIAERIRTEGDRDVQVWQPMRRRRGGRLAIVIALVAVVASAVAASVALRSRGPSRPAAVVCSSALEPGSSSFFAAVGRGVEPVDACRRMWSDAFDEEAPARLVTCVEPQGRFVVYPLPPDRTATEACGSMGDARYSPEDVGD